ncbi:MAG TPA: hypothetical protein VGD71_20910 [Kribbella sp.]|jgi:hypothetical protein
MTEPSHPRPWYRHKVIIPAAAALAILVVTGLVSLSQDRPVAQPAVAPATPAMAAQTLHDDPSGNCVSNIYSDTSAERSFVCALRYRGNRTVTANSEQQLVNGGQVNCQQIRTRGVAIVPGLVSGLMAAGYSQQESQDVVTISVNHFRQEFMAPSAAPIAIPAQPVTYPLNQFGAGTYLVGSEVAPGDYVTEGADFCYWERAKNTEGTFASIIANGNPRGHTTVTIKATDKAFEVTGSCTFTKR